MILLLALGFSFAIALLRGGRLARLQGLSLRWPGLALLAFALQTLVIYLPVPRSSILWWLQTGLLILSYLLLLAFLWLNRRMPGMALIGLGLLCNLVAMLANGGYMPISPEAVARIGHSGHTVAGAGGLRVAFSKDIVLPREQARLWFLGDRFLLPPPFPLPSAFSPGDVVVALGAFVLVQYALCGKRAGAISSPAPSPVTPLSTKEE
ncbi:MAG: DUF5317 domain-containing protein [Chloroflexia bacterium]